MDVFRVCYIEDDASDMARFAAYIDKALRSFGWSARIELEQLSFDDAHDRILRGAAQYDLVVADILEKVGKEREKTGIALIAAAAEDPRCAVVAVSRIENLRQEALDARADAFVLKSTIMTDGRGVEKLAHVFRDVLSRKGIDARFMQPVKINRIPPHDYLLEADIQAITEGNISKLVEKVVGGSVTEMDLTRVKPGLSGASVMRCVGSFELGHGSERKTLLLKVSKELSMLEREFESTKEVEGTFPPILFAKYFKTCRPRETETKGWYALGIEFQGNALTLLDWVASTKDDTAVKRIMELLFVNDGLAAGYAATHIERSLAGSVAIWGILDRDGRVPRIWYSSSQLGDLCEHFLAKKPDLVAVDRFLYSKRFGNVDEGVPPKYTHEVKSHGDLHSRNVLVDTTRMIPIIVDAANVEGLHWSNDISRLAVDLLLSGLGVGLESHYWENVDRWMDVVRSLFNCEKIAYPAKSDQNYGALCAIAWIATNVADILGSAGVPFTKWEWELGLAEELLRGTYRVQELTVQKRCLALLAAIEGLKLAGDNFEAGK